LLLYRCLSTPLVTWLLLCLEVCGEVALTLCKMFRTCFKMTRRSPQCYGGIAARFEQDAPVLIPEAMRGLGNSVGALGRPQANANMLGRSLKGPSLFSFSAPRQDTQSTRRHATPVLKESNIYKFYAPASLKEGHIYSERLESLVGFHLWKNGGHLCVKAASMDFAIALPVLVSDRRGHPAISAVLRVWQTRATERWITFMRYMTQAASNAECRELALRACSQLDLSMIEIGAESHILSIKAGTGRLDMRWEVDRSTTPWLFAVHT